MSMEHVSCEISPEKYDKIMSGRLDDLPVLPEFGDLVIYVKPKATVNGNAGVVLTFTVRMSDGRLARVQTVTTAHLLEQIGAIMKGWREGGHI